MTGIDESAAVVLRRLAAVNAPSLADLTPEAARTQYLEGYAGMQLPQEEIQDVFETFVAGMRLKVWRGYGAPERGARALLYLHGGGWVIGSIESHEEICRRIANRTGSVIVAPDYRLAPEAPFPAGLEDCVEALRYLTEEADNLGIDPARIAVGGDSAGGNLATVVAILARDGAAPDVAAQLLIYPNTSQTQDSDSFRRFAEGYGLTAREMAWFRRHYLPSPKARCDWRAAPLRVPGLHGAAPAAVILAGQDVLYSEGAEYATRLEQENKAAVRCWQGQIHGFLSMSALIPEASEALDWICGKWLEMTP